MGSRLLSLKGDKLAWSGYSRLTVNDRGQRRFRRMENCYVSQDGGEIRSIPGYATFIDLSEINNSNGYARYVPDAVRPVIAFTSPNDPYWYPQPYDLAVSQSLYSRAKPSSYFAFEQVGNEIVIVGESRFREDPIYSDARVKLSVASISRNGSGKYDITLDGTVGAISVSDTAASLNGMTTTLSVYVEDVVLDGGTAADQAQVDAELNGKFHEVSVITSTVLTLTTNATALSASPITATGEVHRVRPNRSDNYPVNAYSPYEATYDNRPDDPDALTVWRVSDAVDLTDSTTANAYQCAPAWVANRQRDFGDAVQASVTEGVKLSGIRGASRREQRRLPFRPNVEAATDRLILAAPQYGCMFQVPLGVPLDWQRWMSPNETSLIGVRHPNNSIYDKPRALGIPKPRLIDSVIMSPAQVSPSDIGTAGQYTSSVSAATGSPDFGLSGGVYQVSIALEDPGTGEEGLASEIIEVEIPAASYSAYAYTIRLNYILPAYHFPECMAFKINVYLAPPGIDALAFYGSFEQQNVPVNTLAFPSADVSAYFGNVALSPDDAFALIRSFDLPLLTDNGDLSPSLDPTRLAPQSASMPRGAEACKYIRGVLFSGGALGNAGPQGQLWSASASAQYSNLSEFWDDNQMTIRPHSLLDASVPSGDFQDGDSQNVTLGVAGRAFPDAYQGIDLITYDLFPGADAIKTVDRVLNRKVGSLNELESPTFRQYHVENLRLLRNVWDRGRRAGLSPQDVTIQEVEKPVFYVMPRGQIQISDPGAPGRSSKAFIKVIDPNKGDDISAIGHLGGSAVICTRKETYSYAWYRNPAGEQPQLMSNEFGCIGSNTMVEFDGGLAWLSDRGPVALGAGLQHVGRHLAEDFYGQSRLYMRDSQGMMRHSWGVHDAQRGLVMWGLLRRDSSESPRSLSISYENQTYTTASATLTDNILSRFPCDEILIWSYRSDAWSTWRPPAGLEVYWMRPLRDKQGVVRMCFLAADGRIYAWDDEWSDANSVNNSGFGSLSNLTVQASGNATASTTLQFTGAVTYKDGDSATLKRNFALFLRPGMLVEFLDGYGNVTADTTIASVTTTQTDSTLVSQIELTAAQTWRDGVNVRIGARQRMRLFSTYIGAETQDTMQVQRVQMRYSLSGSGHANARIKGFKSEMGGVDGEEAREITFTQDGVWESLGFPKSGSTYPSDLEGLGFRKNFSTGELSSPEVALQIEISGEAQVRIQDISLEIG